MVEIARIPVLADNYVWLVHEPLSRETVVIDPAVAQPVLEDSVRRGWQITQIWNTHWHPDHTGGNAEIKASVESAGQVCLVTGPKAEAARIDTLDRLVGEGDRVQLGGLEAVVMEVPAHTAGHIAYHFATEAVLFPGDTLFAMGCGRLFEGNAAQMHANLQRFAALPPETAVYSAHEYTLSNGRYAASAEPGNQAIADRLAQVGAARAAGKATLPTTIALELATNPFMRAGSAQELAERRAAKDSFKG